MSRVEPERLAVGFIRSAHGVRGEVRLEFLTDRPERFQAGLEVQVGDWPYRVERLRRHQDHGILKLSGVEERNAAETLRGQTVYLPLSQAVPLEEGQLYEHQIVGLAVYSLEGEYLGRVSEILYTGANEVYVLEGPRGEILLPAIGDCIKEVDLEEGVLRVELLEGLI